MVYGDSTFLIQVSWCESLALTEGTDRPPQSSVMEERMVMEIWVPLPVILGVEFIDERAGAEVGQHVSRHHICV